MPSMTVQSIIDRAAAIADMHDSFVSPAQWLAWYNVEAKALELFTARAGYVQSLATTVDAVNGQIDVPSITGLPLAVLGVYEVVNGRYRPLKLEPQADFTRQSYSSPVDTGPAQTYTILNGISSGGNTDDLHIQLYPKPASGTYRCLYLNGKLNASTVATNVHWVLGWEERIVLGMAKKALIREESDPSKIESLMAEADQRIEEFCWSRQMAESPTVRNLDETKRGWHSNMVYGPYESWYWI